MDKQRLNIRYEILVMLFLVITTAAVYLQVKDHDFVNYDDNEYIKENMHVQAGLLIVYDTNVILKDGKSLIFRSAILCLFTPFLLILQQFFKYIYTRIKKGDG